MPLDPTIEHQDKIALQVFLKLFEVENRSIYNPALITKGEMDPAKIGQAFQALKNNMFPKS